MICMKTAAKWKPAQCLDRMPVGIMKGKAQTDPTEMPKVLFPMLQPSANADIIPTGSIISITSLIGIPFIRETIVYIVSKCFRHTSYVWKIFLLNLSLPNCTYNVHGTNTIMEGINIFKNITLLAHLCITFKWLKQRGKLVLSLFKCILGRLLLHDVTNIELLTTGTL